MSVTTYHIDSRGLVMEAPFLHGPYVATSDYLKMVEKFSQQLGQQQDSIGHLEKMLEASQNDYRFWKEKAERKHSRTTNDPKKWADGCELQTDGMKASFCVETIDGDPVLTIRDDSGDFLDFRWDDAIALRDWLNTSTLLRK